MGLFGANVWAVAVAVPALLASEGDPLASSVLAPLAILGLGAALVRPRAELARPLLLVAFPLALVPGLDLGEGAGGVLGAGSAALSAASFVAFLAAASAALESTPPLLATTEAPFARAQPIARAAGFELRRALVFGLVATAAFAMAAVAPAVDSLADWAAAFGPAGASAATLAAVLGGALGTLVLGAYYAPSTRVERTRRPRRSMGRLAIYAAVTLAGAVLLALL